MSERDVARDELAAINEKHVAQIEELLAEVRTLTGLLEVKNEM